MGKTQKKGRKAFTLIELIVVMTILAIMSTIAFISLQSYNKYARNLVRLADLSTIGKSLEIKYSQGGYMLEPANKVDITSSGSIVMKQGDFTSEMGKKIGIIGELKDPTDGQNYTYVVNKDLTRYELFAFTEGEIAYNPLSQPFPPREKGVLETAQAEDKTVITKGHKLGVLLTNENIPIQRTGTGVDILTTNTVFKAYLDNKEILNGTGGVLAGINPTGSCKRILETGLARRGDKADGVYSINPAGTSFDVYCDMTTDGGGWTLIMRGFGGDTNGWLNNTGSLNINCSHSISNCTFKFSDKMINTIRILNSIYRVKGDGNFNIKRFFGPIEYQHDGYVLRGNGNAGNSYSDEKLSIGKKTWIHSISRMSVGTGFGDDRNTWDGYFISNRSDFGEIWYIQSLQTNRIPHIGAGTISGNNFTFWTK